MSDYRDKVDTDRCYFCPRKTGIEVHHIVPDRFNGTDRRENLVALCERCHKKIEALYDKRFYRALGVADATDERQNHFQCQDGRCHAQATVKLQKTGYESMWRCLTHATEILDGADQKYWQVLQDITGRLNGRIRWLNSRHATEPVTELKSVGDSA
jgi:hypothetical protein